MNRAYNCENKSRSRTLSMSVFEKSAGLTPVFNHLKCTLFYTIFKNSIKADLSSHSIKADMLIDKKLVPRLILSKK